MGMDAYAYIIYGILLPEEIYEPDTEDEQWQVYSNNRNFDNNETRKYNT